MKKSYMDYMINDDSEGCPDCDCTDGKWLPSTATEQEEWWCARCNGAVNDIDIRYDDEKERQAERLS